MPPYGFHPPPAGVVAQRRDAVASVDAFLTSNLRHAGHRGYFVEDLALVRDLFALPTHRDRPDWALVWQGLDLPSERTCTAASRCLVAVRRALMEYDDTMLAAAGGNARSAGVLPALAHYLGAGRRRPPGGGHVVLLADPDDAHRLTVAAVRGPLADAVPQSGPRLRWAWWSADPAADAARLLSAVTARGAWRSPIDQWVARLDPAVAVAEGDRLMAPRHP